MTEMMSEQLCRLCLSINDGNHLNIFSVFDNEMKMCDILSEHFKSEISETDLMPKFVCKSCWCTTETFHELYLKSKLVQEKYLNSFIKVEPGDFWPNQTNQRENSIFCDELQIDVKPETNTDDDHSIDLQMDYNALDRESNETSESEDEHGDKHNRNKRGKQNKKDTKISSKKNDDLKRANNKITQNEFPNKRAPRMTPRKRASLKKQAEFNEFFAKHKHWFDMKCDLCATEFQTFDEARHHYATEHDNPKGYIKCCGTKYLFCSQIKYHLKRHLDPESLTCNQCKKVFPTTYILVRHMAKHNEKPTLEKKTIQCDICKRKFATKPTFVQHMKRHTEDSEERQQQKFVAENFDMKCDFCATIFVSFHDARDHYKEQHKEDRGYIKCCKIKLRTSCMVRDHVEFHLNPDSFKCDICNKVLSNSNILLKHKRKHKSKFICDFCGKTYRNKQSIRMHMYKNHVELESKYECKICHKKFKLLNALKSHAYTVHREKQRNIICEICGKCFYVKFHLDRHMLTHIDQSERLIEQTQCEYCGEWLKTKSGIFYHQQIHTSGIQKCQHCQMELPNRVALLGHIRTHHREKKFKCSYCDKGFTIQSMLKSHEEQHTRHNVYPCKFCSRVFTVPSSRQTHTRRNHQDELKQCREAMKNK